jgi:1-acyl-sn-glycerol-3-phosphate acyltransferase
MGIGHTARGILDTGRISVPTVVESLLGRLDADTCERRLAWWSRKLLDDARVELVVRGRENIPADAALVMSNHQSLYDIPVLFQALLPGKLRMVAKAELFRVPIWGRAMLAAGFVKIDRSDRAQATASLRETGGALLRSGTSVWIAPEGTRSKTGEVGPFKSGGFHMALDMNLRILPVAIDGTRRVLPAKGALVSPGHRVVATILPPVDPAAYGEARRKELVADVRAAIVGALGPITD